MITKKHHLKAEPEKKENEYDVLAAAVVEMAVRDWVSLIKPGWPAWLAETRTSANRLSSEYKQIEKDRERKRIEKFFLSDDFNLYTGIDGKQLLKYLREKYILKRVA